MWSLQTGVTVPRRRLCYLGTEILTNKIMFKCKICKNKNWFSIKLRCEFLAKIGDFANIVFYSSVFTSHHGSVTSPVVVVHYSFTGSQ